MIRSHKPVYSPVSVRRVVARRSDVGVRRLVAVWAILATVFVPLGMATRLLEWTGLPLTVGGTELFVTVYLPLVFCLCATLWLGYLWGAIPAYLSTVCVALLGGMPPTWIAVFAFANPLGLAVVSLTYRAVPMRTDLRSFTAVVFYVLVVFVAALVGSAGSFVWGYTNEVGFRDLLPVWQGWWLGGFLQALLINGPLLFFLTPVVDRWKARLDLESARTATLSRGRIVLAFGVVVSALTGYVFLVRSFSLSRLERTLADAAPSLRYDVLAAVEGLSLVHWITLFLLGISGVFGYHVLVHWTTTLRRSARELAALNRQLRTEVAERTRAEAALQVKTQDLEVKSRELEDALASKDRFFSIISHDLRGPLGTLLTLSGMLRDDFDDFTRDEQHQFTSLMHDSAEGVYHLLETLLTWARLQTGAMRFCPEAVAIEALVADLRLVLQHQADAKHIELTRDAPADASVWGDPNMLRTVLLNLLSNALKFTEPGGAVRLEIVPDGAESFRLTVTDTGQGMTPDQVARLFHVETSFSTRGTANEAGSGLGLVLCHEMVGHHDATLDVTSKPGVGTTFGFTLPRATREPHSEASLAR
ncbi:MAG: HAMP domain-containing sensor histidine kinase [Bacteroidota bacterium]